VARFPRFSPLLLPALLPELPSPTKKWAFAHRIGSTTQSIVYRVYRNCGRADYGLSQQSSNVLFGQSRNVLLTGSSLEGGRRTTADDPSRARPAGRLEEGQEETDHAEAGCRGDRHHRAAGAATPAKAAAERRPGGNP